ncbi:LacI family DNA-binding transcriptional regulator [Paenibacillaceae bacterium WGS1546]|uniref:LacI family DNA-binding transcriptional regulator n=1 Tax=Cohnella sp. WGS1546 TaxID=3366810 RepID=UPI00372D041D
MSSIREIALRAGVSEATVSRVLSQDQSFAVSYETRKAIIQAAAQLNYVPRKKSGARESKATVYLVHRPSGKESAGDTFYVEIKSGLEDEGNKRGYDIYSINNLEQIRKRDMVHADGLIALGNFGDQEMEMIRSLAASLVFIDAHLKNDDTVNLESERAVADILGHLYSLGHRKIAFLGARDESDTDEPEIRERYVHEFLKVKKCWNPQFIKIGKFDVHSGYRLTKELLERDEHPTALFLIDDKLAIGAYRAIREAGLRIPDDISVIGYSDFPVSKYLIPALTTYRVEFGEITEKAFALLQEQREGRIRVKNETVAGSIVVRESTGPVQA